MKVNSQLDIQRGLRLSLSLLILYYSFLLLLTILPHLSFEIVDFLKKKLDVYHHTHWRWSFYIHIFSSVPVIFGGLFQFSRYLIFNYPQFHRWLGKMYVFLILFVAGPSGIIMAFYANGGIHGKLGLGLTGVGWLITTYLGYHYAVRGKLEKHGEWLFRSYALTLSAICFRSLQYANSAWFHLDPETTYRIISWASWIPNLIIAEIMIKRGFIKSILRPQKKYLSDKT